MNSHRIVYTDAQVAGLVRHPASRRSLTTQGLPAQNVLFQAAPSLRALVASPPGSDGARPATSYAIIGWIQAGLLIGLDPDSGEVVAINHDYGNEAGHVNADLETFLTSVDEFDDRAPFYEGHRTAEQLEESALALRSRLAEIDPTSLREDGGFWETLIFDVGLGDYSDDP